LVPEDDEEEEEEEEEEEDDEEEDELEEEEEEDEDEEEGSSRNILSRAELYKNFKFSKCFDSEEGSLSGKEIRKASEKRRDQQKEKENKPRTARYCCERSFSKNVQRAEEEGKALRPS
jgi:hypothetical protein